MLIFGIASLIPLGCPGNSSRSISGSIPSPFSEGVTLPPSAVHRYRTHPSPSCSVGLEIVVVNGDLEKVFF